MTATIELGPYAECPTCTRYATRRADILTPAIVDTANRHRVEAVKLLHLFMLDVHDRHCWCGEVHPEGEWHDPTHGNVDRDIQDLVRKNFPGTGRAQEYAIMLTAQGKRDRGERI